VNYQCPEDEKTYVHRIGRTGRAGSTGVAVTLVDWDDIPRWQLINKALDLGFEDPPETYSTSPWVYTDLDVPTTATGRLPRSQRTREGLDAETLEDLGETGKRNRPASGRDSGGRDSGGRDSGGRGSAGRGSGGRGDSRGPQQGEGEGTGGGKSRPRRRTRGTGTTSAEGSAAAATPAAESSDGSGEGSSRPRRRRRRGGANRGGGGSESAA
jgi:superfamily II DNA/RNA helicase